MSPDTLTRHHLQTFDSSVSDNQAADPLRFCPLAAVVRATIVTILPTPGHSVDHQSLLIKGHAHRIVMTGDAIFDEDQ